MSAVVIKEEAPKSQTADFEMCLHLVFYAAAQRIKLLFSLFHLVDFISVVSDWLNVTDLELA